MSQPVSDKPDVDALVEEAFTRLYARLDVLQPKPAHEVLEQQAHAIIKSLGSQLMLASNALQDCAEAFKMQPNLYKEQRLRLSNNAIKASRQAREVADSVLGMIDSVLRLRQVLADYESRLEMQSQAALGHIQSAIRDTHRDDVAPIVAAVNARRAASYGLQVMALRKAARVS